MSRDVRLEDPMSALGPCWSSFPQLAEGPLAPGCSTVMYLPIAESKRSAYCGAGGGRFNFPSVLLWCCTVGVLSRWRMSGKSLQASPPGTCPSRSFMHVGDGDIGRPDEPDAPRLPTTNRDGRHVCAILHYQRSETWV